MNGKILDYDSSTKMGTISAVDGGERYTFMIDEWKNSNLPQKNMMVDFISDGSIAKEVFMLRNMQAENNTLFGLLAVGLTLFFLFIGTFISRLFIAKEPVSKAIIPTSIHFIATILMIIPVVGWIIALVANLYYMYKNYKIVVEHNNF